MVIVITLKQTELKTAGGRVRVWIMPLMTNNFFQMQ